MQNCASRLSSTNWCAEGSAKAPLGQTANPGPTSGSMRYIQVRFCASRHAFCWQSCWSARNCSAEASGFTQCIGVQPETTAAQETTSMATRPISVLDSLLDGWVQ